MSSQRSFLLLIFDIFLSVSFFVSYMTFFFFWIYFISFLLFSPSPNLQFSGFGNTQFMMSRSHCKVTWCPWWVVQSLLGSSHIPLASLFIYLFFKFFTLQYCIGFAIHQHESTTGVHVFPIPKPPPTSPPPHHPSGSSQRTSPKHPVFCIEPRLVIRFLHDIIHVSMPLSQIIPLSLSHRVQKTVLYICVSFAVSHTGLSLPSF